MMATPVLILSGHGIDPGWLCLLLPLLQYWNNRNYSGNINSDELM